MSGRLVSAVFESTLPAWLKPYAAAFASFAADDGSRVYPTIGRIARMVGRSVRQTQKAVTDLRRRHVLELEAPSGRHLATRYFFNEAALPFAGDGAQLPLFLLQNSSHAQPKPAKASINPRFPQFPQVSTGTPRHPWGELHDTRSVKGSVMYSSYTRARAKRQTPKTGTEDK